MTDHQGLPLSMLFWICLSSHHVQRISSGRGVLWDHLLHTAALGEVILDPGRQLHLFGMGKMGKDLVRSVSWYLHIQLNINPKDFLTLCSLHYSE